MDDLLETRRLLGDCFLRSLAPRHHPADAAVLLVPGSAHGWWAWRFWQPALAHAGFAAHALSFPNHTDAPALPEAEFLSLTIGDYAARVRRVAAELPGKLVLVGHSLGGLVAQIAAEEVRPAALVLVASAGPKPLGREKLSPFPPDRPVAFPREAARARWFVDTPAEVMDWALDRVGVESPGVLNGSGGRAEVDRARITCPVLVVGAGRDASSVPPQEELAALYGATLLAFPEAGHDLMLERVALRAVRGVIGWLDRVL
jgi:pimeloyl-ACP methyl ester carboxylesterase